MVGVWAQEDTWGMLAQDTTTTTRNSVSEATHGRRILAIIPCCPCILYTRVIPYCYLTTPSHMQWHNKQNKPNHYHAMPNQENPTIPQNSTLNCSSHLLPWALSATWLPTWITCATTNASSTPSTMPHMPQNTNRNGLAGAKNCKKWTEMLKCNEHKCS